MFPGNCECIPPNELPRGSIITDASIVVWITYYVFSTLLKSLKIYVDKQSVSYEV